MKYRVRAGVTISISAEVEADSAEEAKKKAEDLNMQSFCYHRASEEEGMWTTTGELDGAATDIEVEGA